MTTPRIQLSRPSMPPLHEYGKLLEESFKTGRITEGENVRKLEERVKSFTKAKNCMAVCNGTTALMMALAAVRCSTNDSSYVNEIIMPSFTFGATLQAVLLTNFTPRFVDVQPDGTLDPEQLTGAINKKTAAVLAVDTFGLPCDWKNIREYIDACSVTSGAGRYIPLIVDSAQSLGAQVDPTPHATETWGAHADIHVFSMSPSKPISAGEGGLITWTNSMTPELFSVFKSYGFDTEQRTNLVAPGWNGRMSEMNAALGRLSMENAYKRIQRRRHIAANYIELLGEKFLVFDWAVQQAGVTRYSSCCYFVVRVNNRDTLQRKLAENHIESKPYFSPAMHQTAWVISGTNATVSPDMSVTNDFAKTSLALPMHNYLSDRDIQQVADVVLQYGEPTDE